MSKHPTSVPADFFSRLLALLIDNVLWTLPIVAGAWYVSMQKTLVDVAVAIANVFLMVMLPMGVVYVIYVVVMTSRFGGTIGKLALGLDVVDEEGNNLTWKRAFFREAVAKWVSGFLLGAGYFAMLWHPKKLTWHDTLAGSMVRQQGTRYVEGMALLLGIGALIGWLGFQTFQGFSTNTQLINDFKQLLDFSY